MDIAEAGGAVTVRLVRVVREPAGSGPRPPGSTYHYRREGDALRFVGLGLPGRGVMGPSVATIYRRCQ